MEKVTPELWNENSPLGRPQETPPSRVRLAFPGSTTATSGGGYLIHSLLERFGLRADIEERKPLGNSADGCRCRSQFILGMVLKHRQSVIWMDVDTEVRRYP